MTLRLRLTAAAAMAVALGLLAGCGRAPDPADTPAADAGAPIRVTEARIRAVVPGRDMTAAYFTIENRGQTPFVLTGVESTQARAIEIHTVERDGDMARMRRLPQIAVEPGALVQFAPGGLHLMIFGVSEPLDPFTATLVSADGQRLEVAFETIAPGGN